MKKYLLIVFLVALVFPSVALASWWNPLSWNWADLFRDKETPSATVVATTTLATTTEKITTAVTKPTPKTKVEVTISVPNVTPDNDEVSTSSNATQSSLPIGCTSVVGYSVTTGARCDGSPTPPANTSLRESIMASFSDQTQPTNPPVSGFRLIPISTEPIDPPPKFVGKITLGPTGTNSNNPSSPFVDIKVNGSNGPVTVYNGSYSKLTWSSYNVDSCVLSGTDGIYLPPLRSGHVGIKPTEKVTYEIVCRGLLLANGDKVNETVSDSVTVEISN